MQVVLNGFDRQWIDESFRASAIACEIESHFERLLDREGLRVRVWDADAPETEPIICHPIDYVNLSPGASLRLEVPLGFGQTANCNLCVLDGATPATGTAGRSSHTVVGAGMHASRFFVGGRRIAACGSIASFVRSSSHRWTIWSNPCVAGYIDVRGDRAGPLQPVITRDEFKNSAHRLAFRSPRLLPPRPSRLAPRLILNP